MKLNTYVEITKPLKTEKENRNSVRLYWNGTGETWNAYGKSAENTMRINPELRTLMDKAGLDGTQMTHLKVIIERFEEYDLTDHCVAVNDKRLKLKLKN